MLYLIYRVWGIDMKREKRNVKTYIFAIISILSFILVCIGTSVAFFVSINATKETEVSIKSANVSAMFNALEFIDDKDILPGYSGSMHFSITNTSEEENAYGNYTLMWMIDVNEIDSEDFVYNIIGSSYRGENNIPISNTNKLVSIPEFRRVPSVSSSIGTGTINTGVTHSYTLTVKFLETGEDQSDLRIRAFKGRIAAKGEPNVGGGNNEN